MTHTYMNRPKIATSLVGMWFPPKQNKILYIIYRSIVMGLIYSFLVFNCIYLWLVWGKINEILEGFYLLFTQIALCLKTFNMVANKHKLIRLFNYMESDIFAAQTPAQEEILSRQATKMWKLYMFFITCAACNCTEWAVIPMLASREAREFPFKIWMPVDPAKSPDFYIGYLYQVIEVCLGATVFLTIDFLTVSTISFATSQLDIIADKIRKIQPVPMFTNLDKKESFIKQNNNILKECIQQHQAVLRYMELLENICNIVIFVQISGTVGIICAIGFQLTIEPLHSVKFLSGFNYLVTMLSQLYLYCWCGNELTEASEKLRDTLYMSSWYAQDPTFRKTLIIAMVCLRKPIIFRVGYYIPLSRPTFVSILRCSYSYFAVLNSRQNK